VTIRASAACAFCLIGVCATASSASAQDRRVRVSANAGMQEGPGRLAINVPLTAFGRSGSFEIDDRLTTSAMVDVNGSVRVWRSVAFGAGFSRIRTEKLAHPYTASVPPPPPGLFNAEFEGSVGDVSHGERTAYGLVSWTATVSDRFDVVFSGGPAFFEVEQDLPSAAPVVAPNGLVVLTLSKSRLSKSTTGFHLGLDLDYVWARRAGAGILLRYTHGSIDVPHGTRSMTAGGFQIAAGLRLKV
jgi:hypothetical protein